ncbi:putative Rossmann fold nucleotide-binding protein [Pseudomonas aeruginosa 39016]|nr:putative Rossmann fold nucleotide-binding protein [Pseudomonas aeruginosa 39016]
MRQAPAGAASAEEAEPKASIKRRKRMGPSSGRPCRRSRASSSAGEWFFIATHP